MRRRVEPSTLSGLPGSSMKELIEIFLDPLKPASPVFKELLSRWKVRGYRVRGRYGPKSRELLVQAPLEDDTWRKEVVAAAKSGLIDSDWCEERIRQEYSSEDVTEAPLFALHHAGPDIDIPVGPDTGHVVGVAHIAEVDTSGACDRCGVGAKQVGALRLSTAELNKCSGVARIGIAGNEFWLMSHEVAAAVTKMCGERLPLQPVETFGKGRLRGAWFQVVPQVAIPPDVINAIRLTVEACASCNAMRIVGVENPELLGSYYTVNKPKWFPTPGVVWGPLWGGDGIRRLRDGRVMCYPERAIWFRGDVARHLLACGINDLTGTPIIWSDSPA